MDYGKDLLMSVLVSNRKESKFEAVTYSIELYFMFIELMQRNFGIKDLNRIVRIRYAFGKVIKRINPNRITAMRRKLKKLATKVKNGNIYYENVENMFRGWMGTFYKIMSKQQRKNLIVLYEDLFNKTIRVSNKKLIIIDK